MLRDDLGGVCGGGVDLCTDIGHRRRGPSDEGLFLRAVALSGLIVLVMWSSG